MDSKPILASDDEHVLIATEVVREEFGRTSVRGTCECGWRYLATGWTVESTIENGIKPAYARHLRKLEGKSTAGDKAVEGAQLGLGMILVLGLVASVIVAVIALGKGAIGLFDGDNSPSGPVPTSPCPGLLEYLHEHDPASPTWQAVNDRFNREC